VLIDRLLFRPDFEPDFLDTFLLEVRFALERFAAGFFFVVFFVVARRFEFPLALVFSAALRVFFFSFISCCPIRRVFFFMPLEECFWALDPDCVEV